MVVQVAQNDHHWQQGVIIECLGTRSYVVRTGKGKYRRNRRHIRLVPANSVEMRVEERENEEHEEDKEEEHETKEAAPTPDEGEEDWNSVKLEQEVEESAESQAATGQKIMFE